MKKLIVSIIILMIGICFTPAIFSQSDATYKGRNVLARKEILKFQSLLNKYRRQNRLDTLKYADNIHLLSDKRIQTIHEKVNNVPYSELAKRQVYYFHTGLYVDVLGFQIDNQDNQENQIANVSENIAYFPYTTAERVNNTIDSISILIMNGWKNSKPHNAILLSDMHDSFTLSAFHFDYGIIVCYLGFYGIRDEK